MTLKRMVVRSVTVVVKNMKDRVLEDYIPKSVLQRVRVEVDANDENTVKKIKNFLPKIQ